MTCAQSIRVRGVVQGVGFRPFVFRLARANTLAGWVLNEEEGVEIHLEGEEGALTAFLQVLKTNPPPAARIAAIDIRTATPAGLTSFVIRNGRRKETLTAAISPDLPVCTKCLAELFDTQDPRFGYPYINCTDCGPRYSIILDLPYDRPRTTMKDWLLDGPCAREYNDPANRRFHAQPVACPQCGPHYHLQNGDKIVEGDNASIKSAAELLVNGHILAIKGLGGYHLACDARNERAVTALRERKFRKEKPFALMAKDLDAASDVVALSSEAASLMMSSARPIVLAAATVQIPGIAPDNREFGVMLPYTPLHHLLFAAGAPELLVMTSANRSNEPIAYEDEDAKERLAGLVDAFLIGDRPIARRVDDSVARASVFGPMILRRSRGLAPDAVSRLRTHRPILALGADLKNTITLVVDGQAFVSQHIGDLSEYQSYQSFKQTIDDLLSMYEIKFDHLHVVHDAHPEYVSTRYALDLAAQHKQAVQHHRSHIASVLAEREAWAKHVVGVSFDGTGYGDDGAIWGGEFFEGSLENGFNRIAHLRYARLPGGDAAAKYPVQAAAGFLAQCADLPDLRQPPFHFPARFEAASKLAQTDVRTFFTTSMGRLFDTAAALLGFTRSVTFEGQAAMWVEQLARNAAQREPYPFPFSDGELDYRPLLHSLIGDRLRKRDRCECARAFQAGIAGGLCHAAQILCDEQNTDTVVLSGGVFQNELLLEDLSNRLAATHLTIWVNHLTPPNDGGISLGQAALMAESLESNGHA